VVLDAEMPNLGGSQLVEGVDAQRGSEDDLVQVAVGEAMFVHVPQIGVGFKCLIEVFEEEPTQIARRFAYSRDEEV
jgi:hypothetical protein